MKKTFVFLIVCIVALLLSLLLLKDYFNLNFWIENFQNLKIYVDNHFFQASLIFVFIHFLMALLPIPWLSTLSIIGCFFPSVFWFVILMHKDFQQKSTGGFSLVSF